jgi:DNA-binding ferritin-like protein
MNRIKKTILMNYYRLLIQRNHIKWKLEDTIFKGFHNFLEKLSNSQWKLIIKISERGWK